MACSRAKPDGRRRREWRECRHAPWGAGSSRGHPSSPGSREVETSFTSSPASARLAGAAVETSSTPPLRAPWRIRPARSCRTPTGARVMGRTSTDMGLSGAAIGARAILPVALSRVPVPSSMPKRCLPAPSAASTLSRGTRVIRWGAAPGPHGCAGASRRAGDHPPACRADELRGAARPLRVGDEDAFLQHHLLARRHESPGLAIGQPEEHGGGIVQPLHLHLWMEMEAYRIGVRPRAEGPPSAARNWSSPSSREPSAASRQERWWMTPKASA